MRMTLPYFRRQESWEGGADAYRGGDGPLTTQTCRYQDPLVDAFAEAGKSAGHGCDARITTARSRKASAGCR